MYKVVLLSITLLITACSGTHNYRPDATTFQLDAVPEFASSNDVSLVNAQTSTEQVKFAQIRGHEWFGNFQEWTDVAIEITDAELTRKGLVVTEGAPRVLKMSVEDASSTMTTWTIGATVVLKVEAGNGYTNTYTGDNKSPATLMRAVDGAVMRAVAEMLRDGQIIDYLLQ